MSLLSVLLFKNPGTQLAAVRINTIVFNFPMALFSQIFFIGPLVRFIFGTMFKKEEEEVTV